MAKKITTKGQCFQCKKIITMQSAPKHIEECYFATLNKLEDYFLIKVYDESKIFWLYLEVPLHNCTLADLDYYLRALWLECCGHLSAFKMGQQKMGMKNTIGKALHPGLIFSYEYDFGTTTELFLEIISLYKGNPNKNIKLLMRNEIPIINCDKCEKNAIDHICTYCNTSTCNSCFSTKEQCDKEYSLPFVNSPRTGQCGYTGPEI